VTSAHIFFIPGMIMIGMFLGFIFGARAARNQMDIQRRRDEEREAARAARAAKRADKPVDDRPPAEASSKEVVSEQKSEHVEAKTDLPEKTEDKKPDGSKGKGGKGKRAS
jgi:hypothetical protein